MAESVWVAYVSFTDVEGVPTILGIKGCTLERTGIGTYRITLDRAIDGGHADYMIAGSGGRFGIADTSDTVKSFACFLNTAGQTKNNFAVQILLGLIYVG